MSNTRKALGLEIALSAKIEHAYGVWKVPSQSYNGSYDVRKVEGDYVCTCHDFELRKKRCKHIYAVQWKAILASTVDKPAIEEKIRKTYSQNWRAYTKGQTNEKADFKRLLHELVSLVPEPFQDRGRPRIPLQDMLFATCFKVYSTMATRRFMTDMREAKDAGFSSRAPCHNAIIAGMGSAALTPIIRNLITASSLPLRCVEERFAVDSTGIGVSKYYRHYNARYSHEQYSKDYLKLHIALGVKTHIIGAAEVTDRGTADSTQIKKLLADTSKHFTISEVFADKGYLTHEVVEYIEEDLGARAFVPHKVNSKITDVHPVWDRLLLFFRKNRDEFLAHYHQRSNVESGFASIKAKFGDFIRSKVPTAQLNEVLLRVLIHNLVCLVHAIYELGIPSGQIFSMPDPLPNKKGPCPESGGGAT